ncbi:MAG TPA: hypothetical protein VMA98_07795 [Candidatus Acidoferrales bacterium]|nr:hypothetical protein [Candidatus Acidoferrales bacterium]
MLRAAAVFALAVLAATIAAFASGNVAVVRHWSLYAATNPRAAYHLFLEPFPDAHTCEIDREKILAAGGGARCSSRLVLSVDRAREEQLFWDFFSIANPWNHLCGHRPTS